MYEEFIHLTWRPVNAFHAYWCNNEPDVVEIVTYTGSCREATKMSIEEADSFGYIPTKIMAMIAVANIQTKDD